MRRRANRSSVGSLRLWIAAQRAEAHSHLQAVMAVPNHARTDEQETRAANMTGRLAMLGQMSAILAGAVDVGENDAEQPIADTAQKHPIVPPWPCPCGGTLEPQVIIKNGGHVSLRIGGCRCNECHRWVFLEEEISRAIAVCVDDAENEIYKQADALKPDATRRALVIAAREKCSIDFNCPLGNYDWSSCPMRDDADSCQRDPTDCWIAYWIEYAELQLVTEQADEEASDDQ